jgi:hypothetical protein
MALSVDRRRAIFTVRAVAVLAVALPGLAILVNRLAPSETCTMETSANEVVQGVVELGGLLFLLAALILGVAALVGGWRYSDKILRRAGRFALLAAGVGFLLSVGEALSTIEWCGF